MLNKELKNSDYRLDNHSVFEKKSFNKALKIRGNVNNVNGMSKISIPFSFLGLGVIFSGIARHKIGEASDITEQLNNVSRGNGDDKNYQNSVSYLKRQVQDIRNRQDRILAYDVATVFIVPAVLTIPISIILKSMNWSKTGKLKEKLNEFVTHGSTKP